MLGRLRRRRPNIKTTLGQCLVFAWSIFVHKLNRLEPRERCVTGTGSRSSKPTDLWPLITSGWGGFHVVPDTVARWSVARDTGGQSQSHKHLQEIYISRGTYCALWSSQKAVTAVKLLPFWHCTSVFIFRVWMLSFNLIISKKTTI